MELRIPHLEACWFLTGPTACGKSALSLELARLLDAEILSLDSMAVYRRLDVGTAKPSPADRAAVPHHLVDLAEPSEEFSVAEYVSAAAAAVEAVRGRGKAVLFVGGSAMYLKALLRGIFTGPPADWAFRERLAAEAREHGSVHLHRRLEKVDPASAAKLHPNDEKRLVRALEVLELTGEPISLWQERHRMDQPLATSKVFQLDRPREELHRRIDRRIAAMFAAGWVEEVRALVAEGVALGRTAAQAVGYREILEHLENARSLAATQTLIEYRTHRFARSQCTWFRSLAECRTIPVDDAVPPADLAAELVRLGEAPREPA